MMSLRFTWKIFLFCLFVLGCQENESYIINQDVSNAKKWFEKNEVLLNQELSLNHSARGIPNLSKTPDWGRSKVHQMKNGTKIVEVFLNYENYLIFTENDDLLNSKPNVINSLLLIEMVHGFYGLYLLKIYPDNLTREWNSRDFSDLNFNAIPETFSGNMMLFDWNENFIGGWKIVDGSKELFFSEIQSDSLNSNNSDESGRTAAWNCYTITTNWYSQTCTRGGDCTQPVLIDETTTQVCEYVLVPGDDSGSGGPGDPTANTCFVEHPFIQGLLIPCSSNEPDDAIGIDCASFNFVSVNSTWQEAAVSNISFKVKIINPVSNVPLISEFKLNRTVWFGMPVTTYNNTLVSPGEAAEIAASAVQYASDLTHLLYIENPNTPISSAENVFLSFLKSKMIFNGGRADYYGSGSTLVTPTNAGYVLFGNGNCD